VLRQRSGDDLEHRTKRISQSAVPYVSLQRYDLALADAVPLVEPTQELPDSGVDVCFCDVGQCFFRLRIGTTGRCELR